jgi:hypothetical protein
MGHPVPPLFVDDTFVYWVHATDEDTCSPPSLVRVAKSAPAGASPEVVFPGGVGDVAVYGGYVYFGDFGCGDPGDHTVSRFLADDAATPVATAVGTFDKGALGLAADSHGLFVLDVTADTTPDFTAEITALPLTGGSRMTLTADQMPADGLLADGTRVYWGAAGSTSILSMADDGGAPTTLVSSDDVGGGQVMLAVVDGTSVYYAVNSTSGATLHQLPVGETGRGTTLYDAPGGALLVTAGYLGDTRAVISGDDVCFGVFDDHASIVCAPKVGGPARVIVDADAGIRLDAMAADDRSIFWIESDGDVSGTIYRLAK